MKDFFGKLGEYANSTWQYFKGKKRWIALTAGLLSKLPAHTILGQTGNFISDNLANIDIGLEVIAGLFGGVAIVEKGIQITKDKLPSGLRKKEEKQDEKF